MMHYSNDCLLESGVTTLAFESGFNPFTLCSGGNDKSVMRRHLPRVDLGITPKQFICNSAKGSESKGPAIEPAAISSSRYLLITGAPQR